MLRRQYDDRIDSVRGLACILLVLAHVIGGTSEVGLRLPSDSPWIFFQNVLVYVRMPLFAMISGFVYGYRPMTRDGAKQFYGGKVRRLLLPFAFAATAFAIVGTLLETKYAVGFGEFWQIYFFPYAHYWFIQSIFVIFVVISILEILFRRHRDAAIVILFFISIAMFVDDRLVNISFFSIHKAFYLLPFFLTGLLLNRFAKGLPNAFGIAVLAIGGLWLAAYAIDLSGQDVYETERRSLFALGVGALICGGLIVSRFKSVALGFIGRFSFTIYLYHVFATAGSRVFFENVGDAPTVLRVGTGLVLGLAAPIILELLLRQRRTLSMLILGQSRKTVRAAALT